VLLRQGLQHFLIADAPADLLPAPPVKSSLVAVDSGHSCLLPWLAGLMLKNLCGVPRFLLLCGGSDARALWTASYERILKPARLVKLLLLYREK